MEDRTFAKKAVKHLMENDNKESEWISTIKIILKVLGLEMYFNQPSLVTPIKLKEILKTKLQEKFTQEWSTSLLSQSGKLRFYKQFNSDVLSENY